jgi:recombination protein RecT
MVKTEGEPVSKIAEHQELARTNGAHSGDKVGQLIQRMSRSIAMGLPKHVNSERFQRICMTTLRRTPKLMECSTQSLLAAIMESSQLGLEPGAGQQIHLIPYKNEVQVVIGYQGYVELARRAGVTIHPPRVVREGDLFSVDFGADREITHKPQFDVTAPMTHVWAKASWSTGEGQTVIYEVMSKAEVDQVRDNHGGKRGPWVDHYEAMAKKTVIRRLSKYCPRSAEYNRAESIDGAVVQNVTPTGGVEFLLDTTAEAAIIEQ